VTNTELEQRAIQELEQDLEHRLDREHKGLEDVKFRFTKLQLRVKLFGKEDLDDEELGLYEQSYPEDMARHEAEIALVRAQLAKLRTYAESRAAGTRQV
jgi:hypothetical protein